MTSVRVLVTSDRKAVRGGLRLMPGLLGIEVPGAGPAGPTRCARRRPPCPRSSSWTVT